MAKKIADQTNNDVDVAAAQEAFVGGEPSAETVAANAAAAAAANAGGGGGSGDEEEKALSDFNVETDFKVEPLIPNGNYHGYVTKTSISGSAVVFTIVLSENGGVMSDGETELDGAQVFYRMWLPTEDDKTTPTKSGRATKWQWKVNNIKNVSDAFGLHISSLGDIKDAIEEARWLGIECMVEVTTDEYQGQVRNQVNKITAYNMVV